MRGQDDALRRMAEGAVAGLVASYASKQFQELWNAVQKSATGEKAEGDAHQDDLATVKVADEASELVTGAAVPEPYRERAGDLVHYLTGAGLGAAYALAAKRAPRVTAGFGTAFGAAANLLLNEALLPALGLSPSPARTPPVKHLYAAATHLVFGLALEGSRRLIESAAHRPRT